MGEVQGISVQKNMRGPQFEALLLLAFQNVPSIFLWGECFCNFCAFVVSNCAPTAPEQRQMHFCIRVIVGSGSPPKPCPRFHAPQLVQRLIFSKRRKKHFHKNFLRASRRNKRKNSFSTLYFLLLPFQKVIVGPPPLRTFLSSIACTLHTVFGATICKGQFSILN